MTFTITKLIKPRPKQIQFRKDYRWMLEQHIPLLKNHPNTRREQIKSILVFQFMGNFYGLLNYLGVERKYHWLYLRMNDLVNPLSFGMEFQNERNAVDYHLLHPPMEEVERIRKQFSTTME